MTHKKKMSLGFGLLVGVGAAIGTVVLLKKTLEAYPRADRRRERELESYLKEKYGEEVLEGKRIRIVDEDEPMTKTRIAKDILQYETQ
ncbi:hypothetical protein G7062_08650 [Erysipelothrix sp. HDW6C]|uniref:hypothetical protein n=1 Tax=Erysipelothrix sp. HDW6C TaxID=2714930 RepID=UPI00140D7483|nr:hypothetical protein [Erysipelothrix sp. HDW6C]QIK70362.1 hypothetical protein G7062_08650 [Erysipelothrix sp. HDW6C]